MGTPNQRSFPLVSSTEAGRLNFFKNVLFAHLCYKCAFPMNATKEEDHEDLRIMPWWIRYCFTGSTASQHSWQEPSSCSHSYRQLASHIPLDQLFLQLCGDGGKHPAARQPNFCWMIFQPYSFHDPVHRMATETCALLQRSGLCAEGQRLWALDAGVAYSASTEQQPKGTVAAWIVNSSGNEKSPKESSYCPVVAWAHSLNISTTRAGQDCTEAYSP